MPARATRHTRSSRQSLDGKSDAAVIEVCAREGCALITLDLDFANIQQYPAAQYSGIVVLRLASQSHREVEDALGSALKLLEQERLAGMLWIVEPGRIRMKMPLQFIFAEDSVRYWSKRPRPP